MTKMLPFVEITKKPHSHYLIKPHFYIILYQSWTFPFFTRLFLEPKPNPTKNLKLSSCIFIDTISFPQDRKKKPKNKIK